MNLQVRCRRSTGYICGQIIRVSRESAQVSNQFITHAGIVIVIIGTFIMLFISNHYTKPILRLAKHARDMKNLNFSSRYEDDRDDEIGILGSSMNALADELEHTISELKTANNELQVDLDRRSQQEEMRQEFLANVSHELKTPIALIQGYAEGLQENINDDPESREFYCEVIVDEANKMNKMVKKLLNLNQLEFGNGRVHLEHFDLNNVLDYVIHSTDILFRQNEAVLSYHRSEEPVMVWADEYMIEEVVTNYVSNALNHVKYEKKLRSRQSWMMGWSVLVSLIPGIQSRRKNWKRYGLNFTRWIRHIQGNMVAMGSDSLL